MAESDAATERYPAAAEMPVADLAPGTNLLVAGPATSGTRQLLFDLLVPPSAPDPDHVVVMTTDDPASRVSESLAERGIDDESAFRIIDASGAPDGDEASVNRVSSPADLTRMGVDFTGAVDDLGRPPRLRVGFHSASTLLRYVDGGEAFSFLHVLSRRTSAAGYLSVFTVDPATHDDRFVNVLTTIFDVAVDLRKRDGTRELRVRGLPDVDPVWTAVPD